jgi:hypothetical protein
MSKLEVTIPCPSCHSAFVMALADMTPGNIRHCPNCGTAIRFSGQDGGQAQQALDRLGDELGDASIKVTVKTGRPRPWWNFWSANSQLQKVSRLIWLLIGGGALLFIAVALALAATHPKAPANTLVNARTVWLFVPPVLLAIVGVYVSLRYWVCPYCGHPLRTRFPIPRDCPHCKRDIGLYD